MLTRDVFSRTFLAVPVVLLLALFPVSCASVDVAEKPPTLAACNVPIPVDLEPCKVSSEPLHEDEIRFAAYIKDGKKKMAFRDVGSMIAWRDKQCTSAVMNLDANLVVRDFDTCEEVSIGEAFFVVRSGIHTPLEYGILAFRTRESAERYRATSPGSEVLDYETLVEKDLQEIFPE